MTLREAVNQICPDPLFPHDAIVCINGTDVSREEWDDRVLKEDDVIVVRATPGKGNSIKKIEHTIAQVVVVAIAIVATIYLGPIAGAAVLALGNMAINALVPLPKPHGDANSSTTSAQSAYNLQAGQNNANNYAPIPKMFGRQLVYPPYGATPYTIFDNNSAVLYALFDLGYGPLKITDIKIGNTPIASFSGVQYEVFEGRASDGPVTLVTDQVSQTDFTIQLLTNGSTATRRTDPGTTTIGLDIGFPAGLNNYNASAGTYSARTVSFTVHANRVSDNALVLNTTITFTQNNSGAVLQSFTYDLAADQYDITLTRNTTAVATAAGIDIAMWTSLRSIKPLSGPLVPKNHAKIVMKINASEQINGQLNNINCVAQSYVQVWDGSTWSEQLNTHPAWAFYDCLTGVANNRAVSTSEVDLASLLAWVAAYPTAEFNYYVANRTTVWEILRNIGSSGYAIPIVKDGVYGVAVDTIKANAVQMFTPRNSKNFNFSRTYFDEVQGVEVRFNSEAANWQQDSLFVYVAGIDAGTVDGTKVQVLNLTGTYTAANAQALGAYFLGVSLLRASVYTIDVDIEQIASQVGDRVFVQHDVVRNGVISGRITSIARDGSGHITDITFDEQLTVVAAHSYSATVRSQTSTVTTKALSMSPGLTSNLHLAAAWTDTDPINVGDLISLSETGVALLDAVVKLIEPSADLSATITLLDYTPSLFNGSAVNVPSYVTGTTTTITTTLPATPVITQITSDETTAMPSNAGVLVPQIHMSWVVAGDGPMPDAFEVQYKNTNATNYGATVNLPATARDVYLPISWDPQSYDVRIRSRSADPLKPPGPWIATTITTVLFSQTPVTPSSSFTVTPLITGAQVNFTPDTNPRIARTRFYIATSNSFGASSFVGFSKASPGYIANLIPGTTYYLFLVNEDTSGNTSAATTAVSFVPLGIGTVTLGAQLQGQLAGFSRLNEDLATSILEVLTRLNQSDVTTQRNIATATFDLTTQLNTGMNALATAHLELNARVDGISQATTVGLAARVTALETASADLESGKAEASDFQALYAQVNTANGTGPGTASIISQITTLNSTVASLSGTATSTIGQLLITSNALQVQNDQDGSALLNLLMQLQDNTVQIQGSFAAIKTELQTQITGNQNAMATAIQEVAAIVGLNSASILTEAQARATEDTASASLITSLQTTVGGHTTSITNLTSVQNGNQGSWVLQLDVDGNVIGQVRLDGSGATSAFTVTTTNFFIDQPGSPQPIFALSGGVAYLNVPLQAGSITAANIVTNSITASQITIGGITTSTLAANATTIRHVTPFSGVTSILDTNYHTLGAISYTSEGFDVDLDFTAAITNADSGDHAVFLKWVYTDGGGSRDIILSTNQLLVPKQSTIFVSPPWYDSPVVGSVTYTLQWKNASVGTTSLSATGFVRVEEIKK